MSPLSPGMCDLVSTNNFSGRLLKVILGIPKFQNPECCWSNGIIQCLENCIDERSDHGQIKLFCLKTFAELGVKCNAAIK